MDDKNTSSGTPSSSALEQFRQQWRDEVSARARNHDKKPARPIQKGRPVAETTPRPQRPINRPPIPHSLAETADVDDDYDDIDETVTTVADKTANLHLQDVDADADEFSKLSTHEPRSALEHYERAVEKESQGSLGDSLAHYRKAYRLDEKVDQTYKNKHFPAKSKPNDVNPSDASTTIPNTAHHSPEDPEPLSFSELITSYANVEILNAGAIIKGDVPPPCPIRKLPTELLVEMLEHVAVKDPAIFTRLALVCKRLAYHVFRENHIWKRIALGREFGLAGQQYSFATDVQGREAVFKSLEEDDEEKTEDKLPPVSETLFPRTTDWREFFHSHPRIRFTGVYISRVNYIRAGGVSAMPGAWNNNVHIVTYYRYLRFFQDGTVISLLTTNEPVDVVQHLSKENIQLARSSGKDAPHALKPPSGSTTLPSKEGHSLPSTAQNILKHALRGRWRLCHPNLTETTRGTEIGANIGVAGDLHIETEGVGPRYLYTLHLTIRSGTRSKSAVKGNKLMWKGFWSYNQLTDDWSEFGLKNDKAFWFSRVKSYGMGY